MPLPVLLALTLGPAVAIGMTLWIVADLVPACTITEHARASAPDGRFDLVTYSRNCGERTEPNSQAALLPKGDPIPADAVAFAQVNGDVDLAPAWTRDGEIEITLPEGDNVVRRDPSVAGVDVVYR